MTLICLFHISGSKLPRLSVWRCAQKGPPRGRHWPDGALGGHSDISLAGVYLELHNLRGHGLEGGMGSSWVESEQAFHVCVGASLGESEHEFVLVGK